MFPSTAFRSVLLVCATLGILVGGGCTLPQVPPPPTEEPNLYQPKSANCQELEYMWQSPQGVQTAYFPDPGDKDFCTNLDIQPGQMIMARCIERDSDGNVIYEGEWVESVFADSLEHLLSLCEGVERR